MNIIPGVIFNQSGEAEIVLWAPLVEKAELIITESRQKILLEKADTGYWKAATMLLKEGDKYHYLLDGMPELPDPASRFQPLGVHGPSEAINLKRFSWSDQSWKNMPVEDYIIYEIHTGTFSSEGTFAGVEAKLDYLCTLGITAIEIMPVAQFPGTRNWGYDGVFPYAVQHSYGGPFALMQLVNACHRKGLAVILDVVYNHLGPEGNYLPNYGPYLTGKYHTPWGQALNFDDAWSDGVREYFIENALMWYRDFHIDALRLDAVHALRDFSPVHLLKSIRLRINELNQESPKQHHIFVESDLNDPRLINPLEKGGFAMDAQWIDEFHHALRVTAGGERTGYYADFTGVADLAKSLNDAYVYDGQFSPGRLKKFGARAADNPGQQFIVFSQNHDQVGNRLHGERSSKLFSFEMQKLMAATVLVSPFIPLLFMGEEWGALNSFQYFTEHSDTELIESVRRGRQQEFAAFHGKGDLPDPQESAPFEASKLNWKALKSRKHSKMLAFYHKMIHLRRKLPALRLLNRKQLIVNFSPDTSTLSLQRWNGDKKEQTVCCLLNFSPKAQLVKLPQAHTWNKILDSASPEWNGPAESVAAAQPGTFTIQPESMMIFLNQDA